MINGVKMINWKTHSEAEFSFSKGVNVLVGNMGSGKSSILQAVSFALFGTFMSLKKKDITQSDIITRNARERVSQIQLNISDSKNKYTISRRIVENGNNEAVVRDSKNLLVAGPNPTSVNDFVKNMLKADDEIFFRTVYSVQNEIDILLKYTPKERKEKIDELMGLRKFDKARNNCIKLRNSLIKKKEDFEKIISQIDIQKVREELLEAEQAKEKVESQQLMIADELQKMAAAEKEVDEIHKELKQKAEDIYKKSERKKILEEELKEIKEQVKGISTEKTSEDVNNEIAEIQKDIQSKEIILQKNEEEKEKLNEKLLEVEKEIIIYETRKKEVKSKIDEISVIREKIFEQNISDLKSEFDKVIEKKKEIDKQVVSMNIELSNEREHLVELEGAESVCPVCSRELSEKSKEALISEKKKKISSIRQKLSEIKEKQSKLEQRNSFLENLFKEHREVLDELNKLENYKQEFRELERKLKKNSDDKENIIVQIQAVNQSTNELKTDVESLRIKKEELAKGIHLLDLRKKEKELHETLWELDNFLKKNQEVLEQLIIVENKKNEIVRKIESAKTQSKVHETLLEEKQKRIMVLNRDIAQHDNYILQIRRIEDNIKFLQRFSEAIEFSQKSLRDELILAVNEMMDSIWNQIYPYEKWQGIRLFVDDNDYILQLKNMNGDWLKVVGFASGGERMLASLAVRIAFSRILAPGLGLIILDEPTHNLDSKAVETLVEIIKTRLGELIEQVFIVTHDERLAEASDNLIRL